MQRVTIVMVLAPQNLGSSGQRGINRKVTTHWDRAVTEASRTPLGAQAREPSAQPGGGELLSRGEF